MVQFFGTGLAQALPLLAMLILSDLYSPDDFGRYTNFMALVMVLLVLAGGKYHHALVLPKKDSEANDVFVISGLCTLLLASILVIIVVIFKLFSIEISLIDDSLLYYVPLYVLLYGIWESFALLSVRQEKFKNNAISKVLQALFFSIVSVVIGYFFYVSEGLIIARTVGIFLSFVFLGYVTSYTFKGIKKEHLKVALYKYAEYPKYGLIPALLNTFSSQAIVFALSMFYTDSILGYYGFTALVLIAPLSLVGASYKDVFYQKIASLFNEKRYTDAKKLFLRSALFLLVIAALMTFVLFFFGKYLFVLIFGDKWEMSGIYASILVFSFAIKLVVSPTSTIFNATNTLKKAAIWQTTYFITTTLLFSVCAFYLKLEIFTLLKIYVVHEIILYTLYFLLQYKLVQNYSNEN